MYTLNQNSPSAQRTALGASASFAAMERAARRPLPLAAPAGVPPSGEGTKGGDIVFGAKAIGRFLYPAEPRKRATRRVFCLCAKAIARRADGFDTIPLFKNGASIWLSKSQYAAWLARQSAPNA